MFKFKHLFILSVTLVVLTISGCKSRFEEIRLSNDVTKKYQEAIALYNKKNYSKALVLFEDLAQRYRGQAQAEDLNYYYAYTLYRLKDYTTARFQFKYFADNYPNSPNAEECRYMSAFCYYLDSPEHSLDQENTYKAIDALQLFINLHPNSNRALQASDYIDILRGKLELKAFENAKMYYLMGDYDVSNYKAAVIALKNTQIDYPDIKYADEIHFLIFKSQYLYAKNSFVDRQEARYNEALEYYTEYAENFPEGTFKKEAEQLREATVKEIAAVKKELANIAAEQARLKELQTQTAADDSLKKVKTIKTPINNG